MDNRAVVRTTTYEPVLTLYGPEDEKAVDNEASPDRADAKGSAYSRTVWKPSCVI